MLIKSLWLMLSVLLLMGCAPTHTIKLSVRPVTSFDVVDKRTQEDKETTFGKLEGQFAISKYGDNSFEPDRISILKTLLDERYGEALKGKKIEVIRLRTLVYLTPRTNLGVLINAAHGLRIYPGVPDPNKDWWIFEVAVSVDGRLYEKSIAEETPEAKFCSSCYQEIRSKAVIHALNEFVTGFGKNFNIQK